MVMNPMDWEPGGAHRPYSAPSFSVFAALPNHEPFYADPDDHSMDASEYALCLPPMSPLEAASFEKIAKLKQENYEAWIKSQGAVERCRCDPPPLVVLQSMPPRCSKCRRVVGGAA